MGKRMLEAISATIIIGLAFGAGAAELTVAEKLEDIMNSKEQIRRSIEARGISIPSNTPLSQYSAKIDQIACDAGGFAATMCATLGSVNPTGGTFFSIHPFDSVMTCRYTAPNKTVSGCASVAANTVAYDGTSWPAITWSAQANAGYYIQNNNTANPTCASCAGACTTSQSCTPGGCTVANGTCVFTNVGTQTRSADCANAAGNTDTSATCAAWGACSAGTTKTVSCDNGYAPQNQGTASASCVGGSTYSADFCQNTVGSSTALSINANLSAVCSALSATAKFPYANCGNYTQTGASYIWEGTLCPLVSSTATIYGNARCSTQYDRNHGSTQSLYDSYDNNTGFCYRSQSSEPSNDPGVGQYCWCQMCTSSAKTSCSGWAFQRAADSASTCAINCAGYCSTYVGSTSTNSRAWRSALCAAL